MGKTRIVGVLMVIAMFVLGACAPATAPAPRPVPATAPTFPPTQPPEYRTLSFMLEANGEYMFPIYLRNHQTLHLVWWVKDREKVWFHIITPRGKILGFYQNGEFANGTLEEGHCQGFESSMTIFSPSQYGWDEGYYQMFITSDHPSKLEVEVHYWVEE